MTVYLTDDATRIDISESHIVKNDIPRYAVLTPIQSKNVIQPMGSLGRSISIDGVWDIIDNVNDGRATLEYWRTNNILVLYDDTAATDLSAFGTRGWFTVRDFSWNFKKGTSQYIIYYHIELSEAIKITVDDNAGTYSTGDFFKAGETPHAMSLAYSHQPHTFVDQFNNFWVVPTLSVGATTSVGNTVNLNTRASFWTSSAGNEWTWITDYPANITHGSSVRFVPPNRISMIWNEEHTLRFVSGTISTGPIITFDSAVTIASSAGAKDELHYRPYLYVSSSGRSFVSVCSAGSQIAIYDSVDRVTWTYRAAFSTASDTTRYSTIFESIRPPVTTDIWFRNGGTPLSKQVEDAPDNSGWSIIADGNSDGLPSLSGTIDSRARSATRVMKLASVGASVVTSDGEIAGCAGLNLFSFDVTAIPTARIFVWVQSAGVGIGFRTFNQNTLAQFDTHFFPATAQWVEWNLDSFVYTAASTGGAGTTGSRFYTVVAGKYDLMLDDASNSQTTSFQFYKRVTWHDNTAGGRITSNTRWGGYGEGDYSETGVAGTFSAQAPTTSAGAFATLGTSTQSFGSMVFSSTIGGATPRLDFVKLDTTGGSSSLILQAAPIDTSTIGQFVTIGLVSSGDNVNIFFMKNGVPWFVRVPDGAVSGSFTPAAFTTTSAGRIRHLNTPDIPAVAQGFFGWQEGGISPFRIYSGVQRT